MSNPYEGDTAPISKQPLPNPRLNLKPYNFEIKDYDEMKNLLHCNTPIGEPIIKCPDFHVQLDHTLAVLWLFYSSSGGKNKLTTTQLEWAIRFIDGVLSLDDEGGADLKNLHLVKKHLEELLIQYYAEVDVNKFAGETGRVTAMPVIEQIKMLDLFDPQKILESIKIKSNTSKSQAPPPSVVIGPNNDKQIIKQLSDELAYIKLCRAKIRKNLKSAGKVNRLAHELRALAADIKRLRENFFIVKDASSFILN